MRAARGNLHCQRDQHIPAPSKPEEVATIGAGTGARGHPCGQGRASTRTSPTGRGLQGWPCRSTGHPGWLRPLRRGAPWRLTAEPGLLRPSARRMKRSGGQGRQRAAAARPVGRAATSWSSQELGRSARAISSRVCVCRRRANLVLTTLREMARRRACRFLDHQTAIKAATGGRGRPDRPSMPLSRYGVVTGPAAVFHFSVVPDVPSISPATQNLLVVPGWGAAAL